MLYIKGLDTVDGSIVEMNVSFTHNTKKLPEGLSGMTFCDIKVNGLRVATGHSLCVTEDKFDKAVGRKISLKRALDFLKSVKGIDKPLIKEIWKQYFQNSK